MPLLFVIVLLPIRYAILQKRQTKLVRATAFLHREYEPAYFWWEPIFLFERLIISGWMQLIPRSLAMVRLQLGQVVTLLYTIVLMYVQPYKRDDIDVLAIGCQITLLAFFYGATTIKLHDELVRAAPFCPRSRCSKLNRLSLLRVCYCHNTGQGGPWQPYACRTHHRLHGRLHGVGCHVCVQLAQRGALLCHYALSNAHDARHQVHPPCG